MPRGYFQRRAAERISQHTAPAGPLPTLADLHSKLFRQQWHHSSGTRVEFFVLALDAAHAAALGEMQLAARGEDPATLTLERNIEWDDPPYDLVEATLANEAEAMKENRQRTFARRQQLQAAQD